ncbi:MAG: C25 family cysteine peptidase, partial [Thermodesulfobacteriota bacterium]
PSPPFSKGGLGGFSFPFTVEHKPRTIYFAALKNGDASNFFGPMVWTTPVDQVLSLSHLDPAPPGEATLEVSLQGATAGTHLVQVQLNGVQVGSLVFADQSQGVATVSIPQSLLLEGENRVTLVAQGGEMDVSMIDSIRLTYWHTYTADNDTLRFSASGGQQLFIDGFSSSQVRVVDITNPKGVQELVGQVKLQGSGYAVQFGVPGNGPRTLLAFTGDQVKSAAAVEVNQTSRWYQAGGSADLVIITHGSFLESVRPLKALREAQGWSVALVDVEDIYDEFSFGVKTPQALKDFLLRAKIYWQKSPRFVLLVGDASVDPRNYLGLGNFDWVPTKLIDTAILETASDDWFVDFNGDGLPKMAVGRLPVRTVEEAQIVVSKIIGYERSEQSLRDVLLVADMKGGEEDYDFEGGSLEVQGLLPGGLTVSQIFRSQFADDVQVHSQLLGKINEGKLLVNYLGHGSEAIWRGDILTSDDAGALTNGMRLPFVVSMTCLNGFFQDVYGGSLAEALLKAPQGGAVAVWASSGLTEPDGQTMMDKELVRLLFNGESLTLGEATARAKSATSDGDVRRTWILFGDPTTRLKY